MNEQPTTPTNSAPPNFGHAMLSALESLTRFPSRRNIWRMVGWFLLLFMPPAIVLFNIPLALRDGRFSALGMLLMPLGLAILIGFMSAAIPGHIAAKGAIPITVVAGLSTVVIAIYLLWISANWYKLTFGDMFLRSITFENLMILWFIYAMTLTIILGIVFACILGLSAIGFYLFNLKTIYDTLVNDFRIRRPAVWMAVLVVAYLTITWVVYEVIPATWVIGTLGLQQIAGWGMLILVGMSIAFGLNIITFMYVFIPQELVRVRVGNAITRMVFMLIMLFVFWWLFFTATALNLTLVRPSAFVFADGRIGRPSIFDLWIYAFSIMTNASYGELKPVGFSAHILVMTMTAAGLSLLVIFVAVALSLKGREQKSSLVEKH